MINESIWMDFKSKYVAIEKVYFINQRIGYPDGLDKNITDIENKYQQVFLFYFISILLFTFLFKYKFNYN
jgi:predicted metalloendopeptidase